MVVSGKSGNWTNLIWDKSEAEVFEQFGRSRLGNCNIQLERAATNFGENVQFSQQLLPHAKTVTFVTKPNSVLRLLLTVQEQWPSITPHVSAPKLSFPNDVSRTVGTIGVISEMVGDFQRILKYPELGFQIEHQFPPGLIESWNYLVARGFTGHMMRTG